MSLKHKLIKNSILLFFIFTAFISPSQAANKDKKTYIIGIVPQFETLKLHSIWRPILNYLEKNTGHQFKIQGSQTISEFEREFIRGDFDFAYMNPYHMVVANESQQYIPLVRDISKKLYGVLVVKKDANIEHVSQLDGQTIAFPAPNALGASLMMRQELVDKFKINFKPSYVKTHDSVYLNVLLGSAKAGGGVQKTLSKQKKAYQNNLKIIHKTKGVVTHPIAVHPRVPESVSKEVQSLLIELGQFQAGVAMLSQIPINRVGLTQMSDYLPLKDLNLERFYVEH